MQPFADKKEEESCVADLLPINTPNGP